MRKKWWIIPVVILCIGAALACVFWDVILIYTAPKMILTKALVNTSDQLMGRIERSPLKILAGTFDENSRYTIEMELEKESDRLGSISYDMSVRTDGAGHQFLAEGTVSVVDSSLDLSLYMNRDFAALTSQSLLQGDFYGITFDTFSEDVRSSRTLAYLIGEDTLTRWEESLEQLQQRLERDYTFHMPEISESDIQTIIGGIMALKPDVARDTVEWNGRKTVSYKISFLAETAELSQAADYLPETMSWARELTKLSVHFWVAGESVISLQCDARAGDERYQLKLDIGDSINASFISASRDIAVSSTVADSDGLYRENLKISTRTDGIQTDHTADYEWDAVTGDMALVLDGKELSLNLRESEEGFRLQTEHFDEVMGLLLGEDAETAAESRCTMYVSKGSSLEMPGYKNMDQWSFSDLLVLFGGIGSMFGLNFE